MALPKFRLVVHKKEENHWTYSIFE